MAGPDPGSAAASAAPVTPDTGRGRGRTALAVVLIVLASLLVPVSIVAGWAKELVSDTDAFVATLGPLAGEPAVQEYVASEAAAAINDALDIEGLVDAVVDGLAEVVERDRARAALEALRVPAQDGLEAAIEEGAARAVASDSFTNAWNRALQRSHEVAVTVLESDSSSVVAIVDDGLGLQLGPLVEHVRASLLERGFALASSMPETDRTIVLVPSEALPMAQSVYRGVVAAGYWLALIALLLVVVGVALSRRPARAALAAALAWAAGALLVLAALWLGREVAAALVPEQALPEDVLRLVYNALAASMAETALAILVLALAAAVATWLSAEFRTSRGARAVWHRFRAALWRRGFDTGRVGRWLHDRDTALRILVGAAAAVFLIANRPLTVTVALWTVVASGLVLAVLSVLARPPDGNLEPQAGG